MDGIFPHYSFIKHDGESILTHSSHSSSSHGSANSYSPPVISPSPQRVQRKPVSNNPILRSSPQKNYHAADTIHPNRLKPSVSTSPSTEKYIRTRSYSQGSAAKPTFWYPRIDTKKEPQLKRGLSKKIRGLLQPNKVQIEQASNDLYLKQCQASLKRLNKPELDIKQNPFHILSLTHNESTPRLKFKELDFTQVDNYAMTVQQRGPLLTPSLLSQKFLVRPYKNDLFRLRALFIWIIRNIRPEYHRHEVKKQLMQPSKSTHLKQRFSKSIPLEEEEIIDTMDILQEEFNALLIKANESAEQVLETRSCQSSFGMATLFKVMATAAGFNETKVIQGYLKGCYQQVSPKDTNQLENKHLNIDHAWCSVKIDGEDRLIDCWLASIFHPLNESNIESHWFLTQPIDMILTHLPKDPDHQYLDLPLTQYAFLNLPYVRKPFFWYNIHVEQFRNHLDCNDQVYYLSLKLDSNIACYAETEGEDGSVTRALAQCFHTDTSRSCEIKAVLPPNQTKGWLKVYIGPKLVKSNQMMVSKHPYPLTMCVPIQQQSPDLNSFEFVQLYQDHNEFYIQEPQCYQLFPLQKYLFCIRGNRLDQRASHQKLAVKSPSGKLVKLMYYPQDQSYDGNVTVSEIGKWSLICLLHHTGGWYTVASWYCST